MKKFTRHLITGLSGAAMLAFASCSTTSDNPEYQTYNGYGDYGDTANSSGDYATTTDTGTGGGGAYPIKPQNEVVADYGNDYGTDYGSSAGTGGGGGGAAANSGQTHTVMRGDNLYRISLKYGTTVSNIKAANGLTSDLIRIGDVLVVR